MKLPKNEQAEWFALGIIAAGGLEVLTKYPWQADMFTHAGVAQGFAAVQRLAARGETIDALTVAMEVQRQHPNKEAFGNFVATLNEGGMAVGSASYYFGMLSELRTARNAIKAATSRLADVASLELAPEVFAEEIALAAKPLLAKPRKTLKDQLLEMVAMIEEDRNRERYSTGLPGLDSRLNGGLEPGELFVVGGETSGGKSVLLQMAAVAFCRASAPTVFFSLEMPSSAILARMTANVAGVAVMQGERNAHYLARINSAVATISRFPLSIRDDVFSLAEIMREARLSAANGAKAVVVDYIQRVDHFDPKGSREQAVAEITRQLKRLALETGLVVLTATQLNDEGRVRESRAIGQDADILTIIRTDKDKRSKIHVDKFRRGERDTFVGVKLNGALARFEETNE